MFDGVLVFDLRDDEPVAAEALKFGAHGVNVGFFAAEAEREIVEVEFCADREIPEVLGRQGRQVDLHAGQVDVTPRPEHAACEHLAADAVVLFAQDFHVDVAVVHEDDIALGNVVDEPIVVNVHRIVLLAARSAHGELEGVAGVQVQARFKVAGADGRALGVHHDGDVGGRLAGCLADALDDSMHPVVLGVAHVEPEDVCPGGDELGEHLRRVGGGAEGADDLGFAHGRQKAVRASRGKEQVLRAARK